MVSGALFSDLKAAPCWHENGWQARRSRLALMALASINGHSTSCNRQMNLCGR